MEPSIYVGKGTSDVRLLARMANRHGLVAGATGTGKTVTLQVLAEGFSRLGVPVFMADVKGDLAGMAMPGGATAPIGAACPRVGRGRLRAASHARRAVGRVRPNRASPCGPR